jgi:glycosyltransferase involved in cell wall biosynthesis
MTRQILVWQWGRRGAGPRFAVDLAAGVAALPGTAALLSLSYQAELLRAPVPPFCDLPVSTYRGPLGLAARLLALRPGIGSLVRRLGDLRLAGAICAMPAPLDLMMAGALHRIGVPFLVLVHDAEPHPGDGLPLQMYFQRRLLARADAVAALSAHVAESLTARGGLNGAAIVVGGHPPWTFGPPPPPPRAHGGAFRLLSFGRLLPYKGLDLLDAALAQVGPRDDLEVRVVGQGPETEVLRRLRARPGVSVENRWVPEGEIAALLGWADGLVLPYREATQSGVAAAAVAAGRYVLATSVGGLVAQLQGVPDAELCAPTPDAVAASLTRLVDRAMSQVRRAPPAAPDPRAHWQALARTLVDALPAATALTHG